MHNSILKTLDVLIDIDDDAGGCFEEVRTETVSFRAHDSFGL